MVPIHLGEFLSPNIAQKKAVCSEVEKNSLIIAGNFSLTLLKRLEKRNKFLTFFYLFVKQISLSTDDAVDTFDELKTN